MLLKNYKKLITVILISVTMLCVYGYKYYIQQEYAKELIRFHVIANSDTLEDQTIKLHVRDAIVNKMKQKFIEVDNKEEALAVTRESLAEIKQLAVRQIEKDGKDYQVDVMLGDYHFPEKTYGDITLPAGKYQAVRVVIGEGRGHNWWCVLFPPLCFVDSVQEIKDGEKPHGYKVFERDNVEYRLRSLEWFGLKN